MLVYCVTNTLTYNEMGWFLSVDEPKGPTHCPKCS
jgi:hypothetical protein